ncbi:MAG: tetratricopeptide repeat protein [Rikenellaceae bacterium]|nr:tetratricopeptide repeat protein [Rikenellaceae bacterium]
MKRILTILTLLTLALTASAQVDRHDVRAGNRKFNKEEYKQAEIDYRKAVVKDSLSVAGEYNLASALYRQEDFDGAGKALDAIKDLAPVSEYAGDYYFNQGNIALQKEDYASAVESFKQSLLLNPGDLDAKENYIYAKKKLQDQQNGGGGQDNQDQNQDQDQDNQDQNQNQDNQDQNQNQDQNNQDQDNQDQNQDQSQQPQDQKISPQQAQQMLQAIQAKEKETQDKVKKEKAELLRSKQKEKNW